jgi:translation initiation factor eIF-2B subunit delta
MGNAIRQLKAAIVEIDPSTSEDDAKSELLDVIDMFIRERFTAADDLISKFALQKIHDGDVILTFSKSSLVQRVLLDAHKAGRSFQVIVVDGKPLYEGKRLAKDLAAAGISVEYFLMTGVEHAMRRVTKVFIGAHGLLGNGALYSRIGTALIAMHAHVRRIPVLACAQTVKFSEKIFLDSINNNELAPPEQLIPDCPEKEPLLKKLDEDPNFHMVNVLFDLTPPEYITTVINEQGLLPPSAVPAVLRAQETARANPAIA